MSRPFDEVRYRALLEGLEISEVHYSKVTLVTETVRFDPEYFQQRHLLDSAHVTSAVSSFCSFRDIGISIDASAFYPAIEAFYDQGDLPFLRVADVDSVIDFQACTRIPADLCNRFPTLSKAHPGDIIFTKGGSVARIGLVTETAAVSRDLIFLNTSKLEEANRVFLYIYFQTDFFNRVLLRSSSQTAQPHLTITLVRELPVFLGSHALKNRCLHVIQQSFEARSRAIALQQQAEQTLLRALGLEKWQPPEPLTYIRSSRDAFAAGRLDAEYFYPAKQAALDILAALPGRTVGEMFQSIRDLWQPEDAPPNMLVRNYDLTNALTPFLDNTTDPVSPDSIESTKKRIQKGDLVVSRLRSYLREIAIVLDGGATPMVASTEFIILRQKADSIRVEALLIYLRSILPQLIFKWSQDGSNHPRFDEKELLNLRVPDLIIAQQDHFAEMLQATICYRRRAAELLNAAKRAVEIAIESGEAAALEFLNKTTEGGFSCT